jgi:hypothetical protein
VTLHHYELRLLGTPPEQALAELGAGESMAGRPETVIGRAETVLITSPIGQGDLSELLVRISDLGLDIREVRRLPEASRAR